MASHQAIAAAIRVIVGSAPGDPDVAAQSLQYAIQQEALDVVRRELSEAAQARREAEALDLEDFAQQPAWLPEETATQEDGAAVVTAGETSIDCPACGALVNVLLLDSGRLLQNCPACGQLLSVGYEDGDLLVTARTAVLSLSKLTATARLETHCDMCRRPVDLSHAVKYEDGYFCPACASGEMRRDAQLIHRLQQRIAALRVQLKGTQPAQDATATEDDLPF